MDTLDVRAFYEAKVLEQQQRHLKHHDAAYSLEPNVTFTPDGRWIVFRSNMFGPTHVFAVEVEKGERR